MLMDEWMIDDAINLPESFVWLSTRGDGDRLLAVPDGTNCLDFTPGLFQQGFPLNGVSLPATDGGRRYSWGSGLVRANVGYYALCWCSNADADPDANVSVCSEAGPFSVPGGVIRIGSSKEFQFINNGGEFLGWNGEWIGKGQNIQNLKWVLVLRTFIAMGSYIHIKSVHTSVNLVKYSQKFTIATGDMYPNVDI